MISQSDAGSITIMDGGMGSELLKRLDIKGGLWSAQALVDSPAVVGDVHRDYVKAGARIIITNTYSTIPSYLGKAGIADDYLRYAELAGRIARQVADESPENVMVLGSIPPLDESYRADLVPSSEVAEPIYRNLTRTLASFVDGYLCETMSSIEESVNAMAAVRQEAGGKPVWIAWTLAEDPGKGLRSGEEVSDAVTAVSPFKPDAYLFNCTSPDAITDAMSQLRQMVDKPIGAYPNRLRIPAGWTLDNEVATGHRELSIEDFVHYARRWGELGASIVGGCCGIGPEYISALSRELSRELN